MKISLNWLNDFIDLDKISTNRKEAAEIIAEKLTGVGFEVEEIVDVARHLHHVKVGKILKIYCFQVEYYILFATKILHKK